MGLQARVNAPCSAPVLKLPRQSIHLTQKERTMRPPAPAALGPEFGLPGAAASLLAATGALASPPPTPLPSGQRVGRYTLLRLLDVGGMGAVYEARQDDPQRLVALKIMRAGHASPSAFARFQEEARLLARFHHPHIAHVHEAGLHQPPDGGPALPFFAMELVEGALPIDLFVKEHALGVGDRLRLFLKVCDAVHHAHQKGVIHRDLKPANILIGEDGEPKVIDFGIARLADASAGSRLTQPGHTPGTPAYMSPEHFETDPAAVDARSDLYSLGVILYELLTDRLPYELTGSEIYRVADIVRHAAPTPLAAKGSGVDADVAAIVHKTLAKSPANRYPSAAALGDDLNRHLRGESVVARPPSLLRQLSFLARRNRVAALALAFALITLVVGTAVSAVLAARAVKARCESDWNAYAANLAAAQGALARFDVADARARIAQAQPPGNASAMPWEIAYLRRRLEDEAQRGKAWNTRRGRWPCIRPCRSSWSAGHPSRGFRKSGITSPTKPLRFQTSCRREPRTSSSPPKARGWSPAPTSAAVTAPLAPPPSNPTAACASSWTFRPSQTRIPSASSFRPTGGTSRWGSVMTVPSKVPPWSSGRWRTARPGLVSRPTATPSPDWPSTPRRPPRNRFARRRRRIRGWQRAPVAARRPRSKPRFLFEARGPALPVSGVQFSRDGTILLVTHGNKSPVQDPTAEQNRGHALAWSVATGSLLNKFLTTNSAIHSMALASEANSSPSNAPTPASNSGTCASHSARPCAARSMVTLARPLGLAFHPDGTRLAFGSVDRIPAPLGRRNRHPRAHRLSATHVCFSRPMGRTPPPAPLDWKAPTTPSNSGLRATCLISEPGDVVVRFVKHQWLGVQIRLVLAPVLPIPCGFAPRSSAYTDHPPRVHLFDPTGSSRPHGVPSNLRRTRYAKKLARPRGFGSCVLDSSAGSSIIPLHVGRPTRLAGGFAIQ